MTLSMQTTRLPGGRQESPDRGKIFSHLAMSSGKDPVARRVAQRGQQVMNTGRAFQGPLVLAVSGSKGKRVIRSKIRGCGPGKGGKKTRFGIRMLHLSLLCLGRLGDWERA